MSFKCINHFQCVFFSITNWLYELIQLTLNSFVLFVFLGWEGLWGGHRWHSCSAGCEETEEHIPWSCVGLWCVHLPLHLSWPLWLVSVLDLLPFFIEMANIVSQQLFHVMDHNQKWIFKFLFYFVLINKK